MNTQTIVIVGAGQAGASAILELRGHQYNGKIILIGDEVHLPYERPPLSKDAILKPDQTKVEILSQEKLDELDVEMIRNNAVIRILPDQHQVVLQNGEQIHYDKLLVATGGAARRFPLLDALGKHVYTLRNLEDSQALIPVFDAGRRILLVGGGVIGLELASSARFKDCQVTVLEQSPMIMGRSPDIIRQFLLEQHQTKGVDIRLNAKISSASIRDESVAVTLENGEELVADAIVYGIGIIPNAQLASEAGLDVEFAIKVNENCQSSHPDIYAAGDVATQLRANGQYSRIETWENANHQAGIFARHVMGIEHPLASPSWFWTDQFDHNYQFVGDMLAEEWYVRGNMNTEQNQLPKFTLFGVNDGIIVAGIAVNQGKDVRFLKKMVSQSMPFNQEKLLDVSVELKKLI
ncbi:MULTISPECIES: 3-phenylpropionate/cinnamic acid dioxygenase ferredoxin--NAD(+) reductase subunit [unclassified Acinetobacter]|uniref:3-phenylpropionate/cinnamic acid dioxygenase ferredoxin--NAD(+) reductase subunit n=1 Tax=unclassified Acinetobacter TaxID=196816 RepID=UPI00190E5242|nr:MULTISPECIES: 3-phenylpropionate/cinnamic acid dioxygenase ferredoxin--NAD(+) reductase subunit [unclassified Acinetobacter]MBK0062424.1 FAD-dependent oxidoreductase [Acinetobacter sp. S55]MBK0066228.1 FAD-dependent oxidoreductase [Acinetobacter sp. S54]